MFAKVLLVSLFLLSSVVADTNTTEDINVTDENTTMSRVVKYIDDNHALISATVVTTFHQADVMLSDYTDEYLDLNVTSKKKEKKEIQESKSQEVSTAKVVEKVENIDNVDSFFNNKKHAEETEDTYVSVDMAVNYDDKGFDKPFDYSIRAHIPLSRSKKKYKLYIDNFKEDSINNIIGTETAGTEPEQAEIGVSFFPTPNYGIVSKYSLGFSGIHPSVKARYSMVGEFGGWKIEPTQLFRLKEGDGFNEETNVYCDKQASEKRLYRILFNRSTNTQYDGMNYSMTLQHYWILKNNTGLVLSQTFFGNTKAVFLTNNPLNPNEVEKDGGITTYVTSLNYRKNAFRKWFYYGLIPSVAFEKGYDYKAHYRMTFFVNFYFGEFSSI